MRRILPIVLLALLLVGLPGSAVLGQTGTEEPLVPTDTVPPTEPTATEFAPPVEPTEPDVAPPDADDLSPAPVDDGDGRPVGLITTVVIILILAAAIGAVRMIRRGPAGGDPGGATTDPYDPEL